MARKSGCSVVAIAVAAGLLCGAPPRADEGMWTYDSVPRNQLQARYGWEPSEKLLDHLRLSSVNLYASASFVSADGLILTNHHVVLGAVQRLSSSEHNYVRDGFFAVAPEDEIPIPGMTARVLLSTEDVTGRVHGSVPAGADPARAQEAQEAAMAAIEADCLAREGVPAEVVTLYGGARHVLYRYREYSDLRLVFVPELQAAFFGGDYDNFTYPRYDLDMAFVRAYEGGKPARVEHFLATRTEGVGEGELVFVSGHPGSTDRLQTVAMLEYLADTVMPATLRRLREKRELLESYGRRGAEEARRARTYVYFLENSIKARQGEFGGLRDEALMGRKRAAESRLRAAVAADPSLRHLGAAWSDLERAVAWAREHEQDRLYRMELGRRGLFSKALEVLRYAEEVRKPDAQRLEGFHDAELPDLLRDLRTPAPSYPDLETLLLADDLAFALRGLGAEDPLCKALLRGRTPEEAARAAVEGSRFGDADFRASLLEDPVRSVPACKDPMLELARAADPFFRKTEEAFETHLTAVEDRALSRIAEAGFAVGGGETYPDATGTLRLAFGKVAGYPVATTLAPAFTTFYGLFDRALSFGNKGDFRLPPRIGVARENLDLAVPLNFACTADITGGNSGSPVVDREGRLVGLVFDGNQQSHPNTFVYDEEQARCVAVDVRGILEALSKAYGAGRIAREMVAGGLGTPEIARGR